MNGEKTQNTTRRGGGTSGGGMLVALVVVGVTALGAGMAAGWSEEGQLQRFWASYLTSYCFVLSISLGALFFVALQHVVRAGWSVGVRRLAEILAANVLWLGVLFVPILASFWYPGARLYPWADPAAVEADLLMQWKAPYLNVPFFTVRAVLYFGVWSGLAWWFFRRSCQQDTSGDPTQTRRMEWLAPVALILYGVTVTFASFDWLMSLVPQWFSTIFGLYFFAGAVVGFFAALILVVMVVERRIEPAGAITEEHYHELGKLLLGFVIFWGYMAFSQYMLIWYANIPEESVWYLARQSGPWVWVSVGLVFGHLLIPFFGLLSREVKRRRLLLGAWAVWMLVWHWIDLYWLVMPTFAPQRISIGAVDVWCMIGVGILFLAGLLWTGRGRLLVPQGDPRLVESMGFENF